MDIVYIETSIVSYASGWPSRDIETAARQQQARDWWTTERPKFDLVTSQLTLDEAPAGDASAAADRLKLLAGLPLVEINSDTEALAAMKIESLQIVDCGRGPQLSTCRITAQDLLPYYREGASNNEIQRWIPSLSDDEIALLRDYIRDHFEEVVQAEKDIKAYHDRMRAQQPACTRANDALSLEERRALMRKKLAERKAG